jgi:hypothetical protein
MTPVYARDVFGARQYTTEKPNPDAKPIGYYRDVFGARQFVPYAPQDEYLPAKPRTASKFNAYDYL